jgi:excisionase family DNA binding protein
MPTYLTPEEVAEQLKVAVSEVLSLITEGKLRAIRINSAIRVPEGALESLEVTCAAVPIEVARTASPSEDEKLGEGQRWIYTRTGRAKFRVSGSIAYGAHIWPGGMKYPIKFPKDFLDGLLARFHGQEIPVGGQYDDAFKGSLGGYIQEKLKTKMNPAVYLAALLIDEGYAKTSRRGYIQFTNL